MRSGQAPWDRPCCYISLRLRATPYYSKCGSQLGTSLAYVPSIAPVQYSFASDLPDLPSLHILGFWTRDDPRF